jgi:hypothetical protein
VKRPASSFFRLPSCADEGDRDIVWVGGCEVTAPLLWDVALAARELATDTTLASSRRLRQVITHHAGW